MRKRREKTGIPFERKMKIVGSDHLKPTSVFNGYKPSPKGIPAVALVKVPGGWTLKGEKFELFILLAVL